MIFKAIVVSRTKDEHQVYITIPALDFKSDRDVNNLSTVNKRLATVCTLPGCAPCYDTGDVVFVDFEQDNLINPIVIGSLYRENKGGSVLNINAESLSVAVNTKLSDDTYIGGSYYENLPSGESSSSGGGGSDTGYMKYIEELQGEIDEIQDDIDEMEDRVTYGDTDLTAGVSLLDEGHIYLYYE